MDKKSEMFDTNRQLIIDAGGFVAMRRRMAIAKVFFTINQRAKKGEESLDFIKISQMLDFSYPVDLYTETGVAKLRIPPHSCFIIKEQIISDTIYRVDEFAQRHKGMFPDANVYLLYIDQGELNEQVVRETKKQNRTRINQIDTFVEKLNKTAKINNDIINLEQDWKAKRELIVTGARFSFREDKSTFFLGAGVSMDAGGPSWEELLRKILRRFKKMGRKGDFDKVYDWCGMSPIIMGRYAASNKKILNDVSEYLRRYVLYKGVNENESELIKVICEAVKGNNDDERVVLSGKVDSIITYNYDDLLETALEHQGVSVARIYLKGRNHRNELPVYHVHGLIPKVNNGIISTPILGEKEYHQIYKESYHWSNVEQLHALDRNTCFFIGMSMTDPNLRRLLDISQTGGDKDCKHYAFLQRKPMFHEDEVEKNREHFDTIEFQLSDLGVNVIWYEKHEEVPRLIRKIIAPMRLIG